MNKIVKNIIFQTFFSLAAIFTGSAQNTDTLITEVPVDSAYEALLSSIENSDIGYLWAGEVSQSNRIGYIGDGFQRLQLRFISVIQNFDNPYEYFLYGKTKVAKNICEFQGSLSIREAGYLTENEFPGFIRAYLSGDFVLFEEQACLHSGIFRGNFITSVYLDPDGVIYYDDLKKDSKNFTNNEFFGEWEGYYPYEIKKANWGDHRIPFSTGLDMGPEKFKPSFRYLEKGWKEYLEEREGMEKGEEVERWWEW